MATNQFLTEMKSIARIVRTGNYEQRQREILNMSKRIVIQASKYSTADVVQDVVLIDRYIRILTLAYRNCIWSSQLPKYSMDRFYWEEYMDEFNNALKEYN